MAVERHGRWDKAIEVPGLAALNKGDASVFSVSCPSAGNCAAGRYYTHFTGTQGFMAVERDGRWGAAIEVPGLGTLNKGKATAVSVSCASAGDCVAGGQLRDRRGHFQGFVVSQTG